MPSDMAIENCAMRAAQQQGQTAAELEDHLLSLRSQGLTPDEQTFNILLRAYAAEGDLAAASNILDRMGAEGVPPLGLLSLHIC